MNKDKTESPSNFRVRKRDNRECQRKGFWIPADVAIELKVHCVRAQTDESEVVSKIICDCLNEVESRKGAKRLIPALGDNCSLVTMRRLRQTDVDACLGAPVGR